MNTLYFIWVRVNKPKVIVEILKDEEIFLKNQTLLTSLLKRSNIARNRKTKGTKKDQKSWFFWKKGCVKLVHNNDTSSFCKMNTRVRVNKSKVIAEILKDEKIFLKPESDIFNFFTKAK